MVASLGVCEKKKSDEKQDRFVKECRKQIT